MLARRSFITTALAMPLIARTRGILMPIKPPPRLGGVKIGQGITIQAGRVTWVNSAGDATMHAQRDAGGGRWQHYLVLTHADGTREEIPFA